MIKQQPIRVTKKEVFEKKLKEKHSIHDTKMIDDLYALNNEITRYERALRIERTDKIYSDYMRLCDSRNYLYMKYSQMPKWKAKRQEFNTFLSFEKK